MEFKHNAKFTKFLNPGLINRCFWSVLTQSGRGGQEMSGRGGGGLGGCGEGSWRGLVGALVAHAHDACVVQTQSSFVVGHGKSQRPIASHRHVGRFAIWGGRPEHSGGGGVPLVGGVMLFDHCFMFEGGSVSSHSATANIG